MLDTLGFGIFFFVFKGCTAAGRQRKAVEVALTKGGGGGSHGIYGGPPLSVPVFLPTTAAAASTTAHPPAE
ncbi:UNVERIFIED_CONTAM: hypothetical protein Sangu_1236600 [Sesamum angustifolium]|uniref:Secreted protein n=1 Tax=Sesamum angustifolium TaxID=2727405 RepID=A0AAW2NJA9_9LAMI